MKIGWSNFALGRHKPGTGYSYFTGSNDELIKLVHSNWDKRIIGTGANSIDDVCIVPVHPRKFVCTMVSVALAYDFEAGIYRRSFHEEPYVKVTANGPTAECNFAKVIIYSANELLKNSGERSGDYDWEIVCLTASPVEDEPMSPVAMARNQLNKVGGTPRYYTSEEWANAVWYWSQYVTKRGSP
jgi:hypothetical protein